MAILVLKLPDVKQERDEHPRACPYCAGQTFQRWGAVERQLRDVLLRFSQR